MRIKAMEALKRLVPSPLKRSFYSKLSGIVKNNLLTYHLKPKYSDDVNTVSANLIKSGQLAVIIQGPLILENNFTIESIILYKKIFKDATIILSTWDDEDEKNISMARAHDAEVILNKKPETSGQYYHPSYNIILTKGGPGNVNLQLISTKNAILRAEEMDIAYCLKTRSDFRFYRHDLFDYFCCLMKAFPVEDATRQHQRLITSSFITAKYRLYGINDTMMFGDTRDMLAYWDVDLYEEGITPYIDPVKKQIPPTISGRQYGPTHI